MTLRYHIPDNGQAERMNRTIKDATVKVFHYEDLESLKAHVLAFGHSLVTAYNFAKRDAQRLTARRMRYKIERALGCKSPRRSI